MNVNKTFELKIDKSTLLENKKRLVENIESFNLLYPM